jgi:glucosamine-6-phosphate deaminase
MSPRPVPKVLIAPDPKALGMAAGAEAAAAIKLAIADKGGAHIILATGTSQFETLNRLVAEPGIEWSKVVMFHLDEYLGIPISHKASFRKYLLERFINKVPALKAAYLIDGENDPHAECRVLNEIITQLPIDVALVGIGENGHLAFNDPPADFDTHDPYIVVELDAICRKQQHGEGWFASIEEVPCKAISMSIRQIMKSKKIICSVPDNRKALAVMNSLDGPVSNLAPASILQQHGNCSFYLDKDSAKLLSRTTLAAALSIA